MKLFLSLLYIAALPHWEVHAEVLSQVQLLAGAPQVFTGEQVSLRCFVKDETYDLFQWFRNQEEVFNTQDVNIGESGAFSCQAYRKTLTGIIYATTSQPFVIKVVEESAILQYPKRQVLVGDDVTLTCRLRGNPVPEEVFLYREEVEVQRSRTVSLKLGRVSLSEAGSYHCEARLKDTQLKSPPIQIRVLDFLNEPTLQVNENNPDFPPRKMQLVCQVEYHAHPPAPPLVYFFYLNGKIMRPATSESRIFVPILSGDYSCRAKVPLLNTERSSKSTKV